MTRPNLRSGVALVLLAGLTPPLVAQHRFTDPRDGYAYQVVTVGGVEWFAENLRFRTADGRCYENDEANCADHGRLYRLPDAERACPAGWRLSSEEDWQRLELSLGMPREELEQDKGRGDPLARRLKFGGDTGFNVEYSGWTSPHRADSSRAMGRNGAFWPSTPSVPDHVSATAWHRDVAAGRNTIWRSPVNVTHRLSVRCVRTAKSLSCLTRAGMSMRDSAGRLVDVTGGRPAGPRGHGGTVVAP